LALLLSGVVSLPYVSLYDIQLTQVTQVQSKVETVF
jgi:hypothetical protein